MRVYCSEDKYEYSRLFSLMQMTEVITVDGYNRYGKLDTIRLAKAPRSRLVALRRLQDERASVLRETYNMSVPVGLTPAQWRSSRVKRHNRSVLPPVTECDYDIGPGTTLPDGSTPWLVGGNESTQLPSVPTDGYFEFGVDTTTPSDPLANPQQAAIAAAGIDVLTAGDERIRILGDASNDPDYQDVMQGRVLIANGFIENEEVPAELVLIPPGSGSTLPGTPLTIGNVFLERPANAYNLLIDTADAANLYLVPVVTDGFVDALEAALLPYAGPNGIFTVTAFEGLLAAAEADPLSPAGVAVAALIVDVVASGVPATDFEAFVLSQLPLYALGIVPGQRVLFINNIFLGDAPAVGPTSIPTYNPDAPNATPVPTGFGTQLYTTLGITTFDYLLKIINTSTDDLAVIFNTGDSTFIIAGTPASDLLATGEAIYSNSGFFNVSSGGAGFFSMRVESNVVHIMLSNVEYNQYVEVL